MADRKIRESVKEARAGLIPSEETDGCAPTEKRIIHIIMNGGLIQEVHGIPRDTVIEVRDYDVDGADKSHPNMTQDTDGKWLWVNQWGPDDNAESVPELRGEK